MRIVRPALLVLSLLAAELPAAPTDALSLPGLPMLSAQPSLNALNPKVEARAQLVSPGEVRIDVRAAPGVTLYAESIRVTPAEPSAEALSCTLPEATGEPPALSGAFPLTVRGTFAAGQTLRLHYQACRETICYPPETLELSLRPEPAAPAPDEALVAAKAAELGVTDIDLGTIDRYLPGLEQCTRLRTLSGAVDTATFLAFLEGTEVPSGSWIERAFSRGGLPLLFLAVLGAGLLLNLTPCVLPLIPVNLAILGAGAGRSGGRRGFALGLCFGAGIALVYGALGLLSAWTGRAFGQFHASVLFQAAVALVFLLMAAGMLGIFTLDFARIGARLLPRRKRSAARGGAQGAAPGLLKAGLAGAGVALLSGACVAPVLVSTLVLAADLVRRGQPAGALLPFLLGAGMALPWPWLGSGLAALPKPGQWMERIKQLFALLFLLMAGYYALQAYRLLAPANESAPSSEGLRFSSPQTAVAVAETAGRDIFVFYTADWCGACRKMKRTVMQEPAVQRALERYLFLTLDCTEADRPEIRRQLTLAGAPGLPHFAIFRPALEGAAAPAAADAAAP